MGQSRREFLATACSTAAVALLASCGIPTAPAKRGRIGFLALNSQPFQDGLWQGLRARGYAEDQQIAIERRSADDNPNRLSQLATELTDLKVDVIVAAGTAAAQAARDATRTIPIVFVSSGDPIRSGLVTNLAVPGGNVTGTTSLMPEITGKRLELLQQVVPDARRVVVLVDLSDPTIADSQWDELQAAANAAGVQLQRLEVSGLRDVERAFGSIPNRADSLISLIDPLAGGGPTPLVELAAQHRLAAIYPAREFVDSGGLMAYGPNTREQFVRAAGYVDRILRGAKPADLPIQRPGRFELVINRGTAEGLGISMTESALLLVDEVV